MLGEIFNRILNCITQFIPLCVIEPDEYGVRVRLGEPQMTLLSGVHLKIPFVDTIRRVSSADITEDLLNQTVTTTDGVTITASGQVCFRVMDAEVALFENADYIKRVSSMATIEIARIISQHDSGYPQERIEEEVLEYLNSAARGFDIVYFGLTDYYRTIALRVVQ